jgi:NAD(P)-dependent dehydrogenase (short-subunit alcohol dehydrogenase family)
MFNLKGKSAAVTGGGSGIGKAVSLALGAQGAFVYVLDLQKESAQNTAEEINKAGGKALGIVCDVSIENSVKDAFEFIDERESNLAILVNSAGLSHIGNIEKTSVADLDRLYNVNVKGIFLTMQNALPLMVDAGGGTVINLASVAAYVGIPDRFAYSMTKGAVVGMTLAFARDHIDKNIRCNCISPGRVHTPFVDNFLSKNYPGQEAEMFEKLAKTQPIGRMGTSDEIAHLVVYLASDEAAFITGSNYNIDGGFISIKM